MSSGLFVHMEGNHFLQVLPLAPWLSLCYNAMRCCCNMLYLLRITFAWLIDSNPFINIKKVHSNMYIMNHICRLYFLNLWLNK